MQVLDRSNKRKEGGLRIVTKRMNAMVVLGLAATLVVSTHGVAAPGDGISVGSWVVHPGVNGDVAYDSNVYRSNGETKDDIFFEPEFQITVSSSKEATLMALDATAFLGRRIYASESDMDFTSFGDILRFKYGQADSFRFSIWQSFRKTSDSDTHVNDLPASEMLMSLAPDIRASYAEREINQIGAAINTPVTDKFGLGLGYCFSALDYGDDVPVGLDASAHVGKAKGTYELTDATSMFVDFRYGIESQDDSDGDAKRLTCRIGAETASSDKLTYNAGVGAQRFELPAGDVRNSFSFDVSASYLATERIVVRCGANNGSQLSLLYNSNGLDYIGGWAALSYIYDLTMTFTAGANYRRENYIDPVSIGGSSAERDDDSVGVNVRVDYATPTKWLKVHGAVSMEDVSSNIDGLDYSDMRVVLGANVTY